MSQEDKNLLLIDICARLPYHPIVYVDENLPRVKLGAATRVWEYIAVDKPCKPYLRPMYSMTKEEFNALKTETELEYEQLELMEWHHGHKTLEFYLEEVPHYCLIKVFDWLNAHYFDYRELILKDLAIEAPEGMYKTK